MTGNAIFSDDNSSTAGAVQEPLFRHEVLNAQSAQWLGAISLSQPLSGWLISAVSVLISVALMAYIGFGTIMKKARITGITTPPSGSLSIAAPNAGVLSKSFVREGQKVLLGQTLFEVSTERQGNFGELGVLLAQQLAVRKQTLESESHAKYLQDTERRKTIQERIRNIEAESAQLEQEISLAHRRRELAAQTLQRYEALSTSGYVSIVQTQQKQEDEIDISGRLSNLIRARVQLQATQLSLQTELSDIAASIETSAAQFGRATASLNQEIFENQARSRILITAPNAGTITTISNDAGQTVGAGQVLATLIPESHDRTAEELEVHLYAPSRTAGFVAAGQKVLIRFHAFPYQKFGLYEGEVLEISRTPLAPNELPANLATTILSNAQQNVLGFNSNEALYRIKIRPSRQFVTVYGKRQALKSGMTLDADVLQDERRIWEWIVEPLLSI
jgi:membrane fusion protein